VIKILSQLNKLIFVLLLATFGVAFFIARDYRSIKNFDPAVVEQPLQRKHLTSIPMIFESKDYSYELQIKAEYDISALVVSRLDYTRFGVQKVDSVFPFDLCLIWGGNLENKLYQNKSLRFSQDMHFCFYTDSPGVKFNYNEFSNNHLLVKDEQLLARIKQVHVGDQVQIRGKLVNMHAENLGDLGKDSQASYGLLTSLSPNVTSAGAYEIIYVEDFQILKPAHPLARQIFKFSGYGLIALMSISFLWFCGSVLRGGKFKRSPDEEVADM